jgi:hypothetical protein
VNERQETEDFFRRRAAAADRIAFLDFLDGAGSELPAEGDVLPAKRARGTTITDTRGGKTS